MLDYNIFGSEDSVDCDVMIFIDQLPQTIEQSKKLCEFYNDEIQKELKIDRKVNSNLAIVRDGVITACFKGISLETNNSIYFTYHKHIDQKHECRIKKALPITDEYIKQKLARSMRTILSFLSRTQYRQEVKDALKGSTRQKMYTLLSIDLNTIKDFGKNNQDIVDIYKNIAFQCAQSMGLIKNRWGCSATEIYTKKHATYMFPKLTPYLYRKSVENAIDLDVYKNLLIAKIIDYCEASNNNIEDIKE